MRDGASPKRVKVWRRGFLTWHAVASGDDLYDWDLTSGYTKRGAIRNAIRAYERRHRPPPPVEVIELR